MGVEAREQVVSGSALLDAKLTRMDHPMVKYADAFTRNFDLIAERKSVIFHLRELAKASVLSKFLLEADIDLEESWLHLSSEKSTCNSLEVPQMWNSKVRSQIQIQEQQVVERDPAVHGICGGVRFGLDKFGDLLAPAAVPRATTALRQSGLGLPPASRSLAAVAPFIPPPSLLIASPALAQKIPAPLLATTAARTAPGLPSSLTQRLAKYSGISADQKLWEKSVPPPDSLAGTGNFAEGLKKESTTQGYYPHLLDPMLKAAVQQSGASVPEQSDTGSYIRGRAQHSLRFPGIGRPQMKGVDLGLDNFDITEVRKTQMESPEELEKCLFLGNTFWSALTDDIKLFEAEDKRLLLDLFCDNLSDRRMEGNEFVPPDASYSYITELRCLIKEEERVRRRRKEHFLSEDFLLSNPGMIFPSSWAYSFKIARGRKLEHMPEDRTQEMLHRRRDYESEAVLLEEALKYAAPIFDKSTEEGMRFRIYRIGSLELRSIHEVHAKEVVEAVFSICTPSQASQTSKLGLLGRKKAIASNEKITKVVEYVEKALVSTVDAGHSASYHRYYLVLETEMGSMVSTELLLDGKVIWLENENFDVRNSLAKVISSSECNEGATIAKMKAFRDSTLQSAAKHGISRASCKQYVRAAAIRACRNDFA
jgi:hypothetical protein